MYSRVPYEIWSLAREWGAVGAPRMVRGLGMHLPSAPARHPPSLSYPYPTTKPLPGLCVSCSALTCAVHICTCALALMTLVSVLGSPSFTTVQQPVQVASSLMCLMNPALLTSLPYVKRSALLL